MHIFTEIIIIFHAITKEPLPPISSNINLTAVSGIWWFQWKEIYRCKNIKNKSNKIFAIKMVPLIHSILAIIMRFN